MGLCPVEKYHILEVMKVAQAMQEIAILEDDYANVNGVVFIMDMKDATAAHMFQMTPSMAKKMTVFSEEALPLRLKAQHFINTITGFEQIFNMFKPMMSKKMQSRLFVHGNKMDQLTEQIPLKYLPVEYGGENGTVPEILAAWEKKMDKYNDFFKENANYGTDESLRPGKPIDFEGLFGIAQWEHPHSHNASICFSFLACEKQFYPLFNRNYPLVVFTSIFFPKLKTRNRKRQTISGYFHIPHFSAFLGWSHLNSITLIRFDLRSITAIDSSDVGHVFRPFI